MAKVVQFDKTGGPEVLELREVEVGEPGPGELRIQVHAIGLNRAEVMYREGAYFYPPTHPSGLGYEAAGLVEAVGDQVTGFAVGDPVSVLPAFLQTEYGTYGEHVLIPATAAVARDPGLAPEQAAAVWMAHLTAYGALVERHRTQPGDHVLVTAASGSVGLASIQTAQRLGAVAIATTRTPDKKERLLAAGAAHVIVTEDEDLPSRVRDITEGKGVQTVLDPVAGPGVDTLAEAVSPGGRLLVYGALDPRPTPLPNAKSFPALSTRTYTVFEITTDPARLARGVAFVDAGLKTGAVAPAIDTTFDLADIADAHRHMEGNSQLGKIVVTVPH
ncbi:zinc-dependent alcohol dehydrogenase family protein [Streptomyces sp. NPDC058193]|uniref:zinc-dependent alcohol dehydrogenase family protein n=1 Tax=Streptomyces sp. NPDC058193 TaxID=3346373 RepID=UPI0036EB169A